MFKFSGVEVHSDNKISYIRADKCFVPTHRVYSQAVAKFMEKIINTSKVFIDADLDGDDITALNAEGSLRRLMAELKTLEGTS